MGGGNIYTALLYLFRGGGQKLYCPPIFVQWGRPPLPPYADAPKYIYIIYRIYRLIFIYNINTNI